MMLELLSSIDTLPAYALLALVAFCDTLIGVGFFVFGEFAFLASGAAFSATGTVWPAVVVLAFAWAGDLASYQIGARYGARLSLRYLNRLKRRTAWRKAKLALETKGAAFVVVSRLLGPVAWITPFLAGAMKMPRRSFAPAAALGVFLGVGQFLVYGAVGQRALDHALPFISNHIGAIALVLSVLLASIFVWRRSEKPLWNRAVKIAAVGGAIFLTSNLVYFFVLNTHRLPENPRGTYTDICDASQGPFLVYPGQTGLHLPQPVNVVLLTNSSDNELMGRLGWEKNLTFSKDNIGFSTYLRLLLQETPPVSELYLDEFPADSAFQMPGTLQSREHIRWWDMGRGVHFGAISRDDEIAIKYYGHLPVILHDIDPLVDKSRDLLAAQVGQNAHYDVVGIAEIAKPVADGEFSDFETDGGVLVLAEAGYQLPSDVADCLNIAP
ncbi:LssY C-terminal domain-containing protein [uncultured Pelagimonas sp.]|uniref:LssY C-terminal domain-containing protein n=1 Tax=uncultured Pelagimonas sp. TaxID=1618102 RepID=UPI00262242A1|nr:LssY C-terminal domain-containing protein [uncultured Pelagimonas sp.]